MWLSMCHCMYVYMWASGCVCKYACVGCFLFIAGVVHVKAQLKSHVVNVCMYVCVCALWKPLNCSPSSNWTKQKKNKKKHKRKELKAKSTLAIQVDQNVTRGWRVLAPTAPIKLRQQTHIHTYINTHGLHCLCVCDSVAHRHRRQSIDPSIDWSVSERTNARNMPIKCENTQQLTQNDAATR